MVRPALCFTSNLLCSLIFLVGASFPAAAAIGLLGEAPGIIRTVPGENQREVSPTAPTDHASHVPVNTLISVSTIDP